jgi:hypothetical protein
VLIAIGGIAAHGDGGGESGTKSATTVAKAPSYSAAAPSTPSVKSWGTQAQPVLTAIQGDFNDLSAAADGGDYSGMRASCRSLEGNLDDLNGLLPSPDQAVTLELRGAIDDYRQMISICRTLGPSSTTGEVSEMASLLNSGTDHVKAATEAIG